MHPINKQREQCGIYNNLLQEMRNDNASERHNRYLRMTKHSFDHLLEMITSLIKKDDTNMREAIIPGLKLAVTLHHLAEGASQASIADHYRLGRSTVSQIIYDTSEAIYKVLQPIYLVPPSGPAEWKYVADG